MIVMMRSSHSSQPPGMSQFRHFAHIINAKKPSMYVGGPTQRNGQHVIHIGELLTHAYASAFLRAFGFGS
jgi:hypothetical protein